MRPYIALIAAFSLLEISPPAVGKTDEISLMKPSSPWEINYAQNSCVLRRSFSNGSEDATIDLKSYWIGDYFDVTIASKSISFTGGGVRTRFDPDTAFSEISDIELLEGPGFKALRYSDALQPAELKNQRNFLREWPHTERDARERAVTELRVEGIFRQIFAFQTGPMAPPMIALRTCVDDLIKRSGLDPIVQRSLSQKIKAIDQINWARQTQQGLPLEITRAGGRGYAQVRVMVNADGEPTDCISLRSSGEKNFPKYACDIALRHARFGPALDAQGKPVASVFITNVRYEN